jgi:predicted MFS family arabinose efflux permease
MAVRFGSFDRRTLRVLLILSVTQVIGWGTLSLPAVSGRQIAADLGMDVSSAFAGTSILYVAMGLWAPVLAGVFGRRGAKPVMMFGTVVAAVGFVVMSSAQGAPSYFVAWAILGSAGSAALSTAAYILLNEVCGVAAGGSIGALMLVTGLSSSLFWPIGGALSDAIGWRGTGLVYAATLLTVCLPLTAFGLPQGIAPKKKAVAAEARPTQPARNSTFYLLVSAIALNAFVTYGFSAIMIELLKSEGLSPAEAIGFGSALGVIQVGARAVDLFGGGRWDGVTTGLFASILLPVAMLLLMTSHGSHWTIMVFIVLYGLASGILAVARATMPLVFYDKAEFARATSHIALPLNLVAATSPPVLIGLLDRFGSHAVLGLAGLCSFGACLILSRLRRLRPAAAAAR